MAKTTKKIKAAPVFETRRIVEESKVEPVVRNVPATPVRGNFHVMGHLTDSVVRLGHVNDLDKGITLANDPINGRYPSVVIVEKTSGRVVYTR
jgi:hypothetical protein